MKVSFIAIVLMIALGVVAPKAKSQSTIAVPTEEPFTTVIDYYGNTNSTINPSVLEAVPDANGLLEFDSFTFGADGNPSMELVKLNATTYTIRLNFEITSGQNGWVDYYIDEALGVAIPVGSSSNVRLNSAYSMLYDKGFGGQGSIYIEDSDGNIYRPTTPQQLENVLVSIRVTGRTITKIILKGHGSSESISPFANGEHLITCPGGDVVIITSTDPSFNNFDITDVFNDVTDANTTIRLRGCFTKDLADDMESALGGMPDVKGAIRFVIGIPFTDIGIGVYR